MPFPIENIQKLCDDRGETFKSLEKKFGFGNSTIKRWANAKKLPPYNRVKMIADFFNVSVSEISNGLYDDIVIKRKNPVTINDGNKEPDSDAIMSYVFDIMKQLPIEGKIELANAARSLKQKQQAQDAQKELA